MFTAKQATKSTKSVSTNYNYTEVEIYPSDLVTELSDATAEQICGGTSDSPEKTEETKTSTPATEDQVQSIPLGVGYNGIGVAPYYSPLPPTKLRRLGALDPSTRTTSPPKNVISITIPLPTI